METANDKYGNEVLASTSTPTVIYECVFSLHLHFDIGSLYMCYNGEYSQGGNPAFQGRRRKPSPACEG